MQINFNTANSAWLDQLKARLEKLEQFYRKVADLTLHHEVDSEDRAVVFASTLGAALKEVDPVWYDEISNRDKKVLCLTANVHATPLVLAVFRVHMKGVTDPTYQVHLTVAEDANGDGTPLAEFSSLRDANIYVSGFEQARNSAGMNQQHS